MAVLPTKPRRRGSASPAALTYRAYKAHNLCVRCGDPPLKDRTMCQRCRDEKRKYLRDRYRKMTEALRIVNDAETEAPAPPRLMAPALRRAAVVVPIRTVRPAPPVARLKVAAPARKAARKR